MADQAEPAPRQPAGRAPPPENPLGSLGRGRRAIELIGDGRCTQAPQSRALDVHVAIAYFEGLAEVLKATLRPIYLNWDRFTHNYRGTFAEIQVDVGNDVDATVDYALRGLYNRLRAIADDHEPATRADRMANRAPFNARDPFPAALARIINSIGFLTITDAPSYVRVIYAPPPGTATHFGRNAATPFQAQRYRRFVDTLNTVNATLNTIDLTPTAGSFWPTCHGEIDEDEGYAVRATFNPRHYTNEDAFTGLLHCNGTRLFSDLAFYAEEFTNAAAATALAAERPTTVPDGTTATRVRYNHARFAANHYGVCPPANENATGSFWVIGRGLIPFYTTYLIRFIDVVDCDAIFREAFRS